MIKQLAEQNGLSTFVPHEQLPLDVGLEPLEILNGNRAGIDASQSVLVCLDGAGEGVFYELGYADGVNKPIYFFCEGAAEDRGNILKGRISLSGRPPYDYEQITDLFKKLRAQKA